MTDLDRHQLGPLLERIRAGDRRAYEDLFARLRPYLHALVRRTAGAAPAGLDHSGIVQSSLGRIWEHFDALLEQDPNVPHLLGWIKKIVHNRTIDALRRRLGEHAGGSKLGDVPEPRPAGQRAERDRRAVRVAAALAQLPERQRQVVEWRWFDRLSDAEISDRLGGSVAAIRVLRCRALKALRRVLEASHDDQ
jgi:RNA polymerase sigma-70 factor (ECF subfamily)